MKCPGFKQPEKQPELLDPQEVVSENAVIWRSGYWKRLRRLRRSSRSS